MFLKTNIETYPSHIMQSNFPVSVVTIVHGSCYRYLLSVNSALPSPVVFSSWFNYQPVAIQIRSVNSHHASKLYVFPDNVRQIKYNFILIGVKKVDTLRHVVKASMFFFLPQQINSQVRFSVLLGYLLGNTRKTDIFRQSNYLNNK